MTVAIRISRLWKWILWLLVSDLYLVAPMSLRGDCLVSHPSSARGPHSGAGLCVLEGAGVCPWDVFVLLLFPSVRLGD